MSSLPIRWKIGLWCANLSVILLVIFSGGTFVNLYYEQLEAVDADMHAAARNLVRDTPVPGKADLRQVQPGLNIAVFDTKGTLTASSEPLSDELARLALNNPTPRSVRSASHSWRIASYPFPDCTLAMVYDLAEVHDIISDLVTAYLLSLPLVIALAAVGGWWISGRVLRPVVELTGAAEDINARSLSLRVPLPAAEDELKRLARVLNGMLARLERSFLQAERFSADASHELRTPLTIMQGEVEQLLRSPELPRSHEEKLLSLQEEISRLTQLTDSLLLLARLDSGSFTLPRQPINLSELVAGACEDGGMLADLRSLVFEHQIQAALWVEGAPAHLRRLLLNLFDNACRHNEAGGRVACTLRDCGDGTAELVVGNTGPGIPPGLRHRLFERFFRVDEARSGSGHGLGLSLCREIAHAHGGTLELRDSTPGLTEFVLRLPLVPPSSV
jgi:signal transduction histidine kinase